MTPFGCLRFHFVAGALERAAGHKMAFLRILHLLLECPAICDLLEASLAAQVSSSGCASQFSQCMKTSAKTLPCSMQRSG